MSQDVCVPCHILLVEHWLHFFETWKKFESTWACASANCFCRVETSTLVVARYFFNIETSRFRVSFLTVVLPDWDKVLSCDSLKPDAWSALLMTSLDIFCNDSFWWSSLLVDVIASKFASKSLTFAYIVVHTSSKHIVLMLVITKHILLAQRYILDGNAKWQSESFPLRHYLNNANGKLASPLHYSTINKVYDIRLYCKSRSNEARIKTGPRELAKLTDLRCGTSTDQYVSMHESTCCKV